MEKQFGLPRELFDTKEGYQRFRRPNDREINEYLTFKEEDRELFEGLNKIEKYLNFSQNMLKTVNYIRSLEWPGFVNYYRSYSPNFGFVYFGRGIKNKEIEFLLKA